MNKQELIAKVATKAKNEQTHAELERIVNGVFDTIKEAVASGESVQLIGFGTFEVRERAARDGRNPTTGEALHITAKKVPGFKAGKAFKDAVNA